MQYSIKKIADMAKVSKTTVRRHRDKLPKAVLNDGSCNENGVLYYSAEIAEMIIKSIEETGTQAERVPERTGTETGTRSGTQAEYVPERTGTVAELYRNVPEHIGTQNGEEYRNAPERVPERNEAAELTYKTAIDALTEQLRTKDEQIKELSEMLKSAQNQISLLMEKKETEPERLAAPEHDQEEPEHKKQSFFSWLFRKRS